MADDNDSGEKTEAPSGRRVGEARSEGMIARSVELSQVLALIAAFLIIEQLSPRIWEKLQIIFKAGFTSRYGTESWTTEDLRYSLYSLLLFIMPELLVLMVVTAFFGAGTTLLQTKFNFSTKMFWPKFSRLNPITGIKRLFSLQNFFHLLKAIAKFAIIAPIGYFAFFDLFPQMISLMSVPIRQHLSVTGMAMGLIFWRIIKLMLVLSILDYAWQYWRTSKQLKMTKVEVKEERKTTEGDERTKMIIRQRAMQRVRQRMMQNVKNADVVVTNPTHFAVALSYSLKKGSAPKVVAKGKGHMAQRIKAIAREHGIPCVERKPLARALFKMVEVGHEIPYDLYAAVAELLAYVYKLRGRSPFRRNPSPKNDG